MFEYLMPLLVMRSYPETLLDQTCRMAVRRQIEYGAERGVPWGISESAYNVVDRHGNYQYKAFGVPGPRPQARPGRRAGGRALRHALAAMVDPARGGAEPAAPGRGGPARARTATTRPSTTRRARPTTRRGARPPGRAAGRSCAAYLAHHQGMTPGRAGQRPAGRPHGASASTPTRACRPPSCCCRSACPRQAPITQPRPVGGDARGRRRARRGRARRFRSPHTAFPHAQFLSNGNYTAVVTNAGGGRQLLPRPRGHALPRGPDARPGQPVPLPARRAQRRRVVGHPPAHRPGAPRSTWSPSCPRRRPSAACDDDIDTQLDIAVSTEDDVEVRRLAVTNHSDRPREIEVTSYAEIVLGPAADDLAHPAFGKLFVETEYLPESAALVCRRRPRARDEAAPWAVHVLSLEGRPQGPVEWETDRARFLGRGRGPEDPQALDGRSLSGTTGAVLDPDRQPAPAHPPRPRRLRAAVVRHRAWRPAARRRWPWPRSTTTPARPRAPSPSPSRTRRAACGHLGISSEEALLFERLASRVLYADASLRAAPGGAGAATSSARRGCGRTRISGDLPILLVRVVEEDDLPLVRQVLQAQEYWRLKGLSADVVILNEHPIGYLDEMHAALEALLDDGPWRAWKHRPGGRLPAARRAHDGGGARRCWPAVARAVLSGERGELANQLDRPASRRPTCTSRTPACPPRAGRGRGRRRRARRGAAADPRQRPRRLRGRRARVRDRPGGRRRRRRCPGPT